MSSDTDSNRFVRVALVEARGAPVATLPTPLRWRRAWLSSPAMSIALLAVLVLLLPLAWRFFQWAVLNAHWLGNSSQACTDDQGARFYLGAF